MTTTRDPIVRKSEAEIEAMDPDAFEAYQDDLSRQSRAKSAREWVDAVYEPIRGQRELIRLAAIDGDVRDGLLQALAGEVLYQALVAQENDDKIHNLTRAMNRVFGDDW